MTLLGDVSALFSFVQPCIESRKTNDVEDLRPVLKLRTPPESFPPTPLLSSSIPVDFTSTLLTTSTMARGTKRVKVHHHSTAAYAASQPLFDALRLAVDCTNEQHDLLSTARDIVQQTHVKLAESISDGDSTHTTRYIDSAVKAWRSVTASYTEIFDALAKASSAEPSEGKPMREGHESFVRMASMAAEANSMAESFVLSEEKHNGQSEPVVQSDASIAEGGSDALSSDSVDVPDDTAAEPSPNKPTSKRERQLAKSGAFPHFKANDKGTNIKKRMEEARNKHEKKLLALRAKKKQANRSPSIAKTSDKRASVINGAGVVEYEDVSEQVAARLKAKQAKREAAKKEKKRKRESGDSYGVDLREFEVVLEKPPKKRSRSDGLGNDVEVVAVKVGRQKHGRALDDGDVGRTNKKAKTKS